MAGVARVGVGLTSSAGRVIIDHVIEDSPASMVLQKGDVVLAVNDSVLHDDAEKAQRCIMAATAQCTSSGKMLPVRLTIASLDVESPKGIEADFSVAFAEANAASKKVAPPDVREVVQSL